MLDPFVLRRVFAAAVTLVAIAAFITRDDEIISWVFLAPTVAIFWWWAFSDSRYVRIVDPVGVWVPLVLNLIESNHEVSMMISVIAVVAMAGEAESRRYVRTMIGIFGATMVTLGIVDAIDNFGWPNWLFGLFFGWGGGELMYRLRHTVKELHGTRALVADQAALHERRRIARDVHDLVGHSLSVVLLHVGGARHLVHKDPDEAERALVQAEEAGRRSLAEIRRTVALLRDDIDESDQAVPASDLNDIPALVEEFANAGMDVTLVLDGTVDAVEPSVALAGYRITQEALTNVSRHALGASTSVMVSVDDERCEISVKNRGGGGRTGGPGGPDLGGSGFGLVSMRERAKSVGGSLLAGPASGGWIVEASLPLRVGAQRR